MTNTINSDGLLEPQIAHVTTLVNSLYINGFAADASDTGTGKMFCAAAVAREMNVKTVVISPKSVMPQWEAVVKLFNLKPQAIVNFEKLSRGSTRWMKWKKMKDPSTLKATAETEVPVFTFPQNSLIIVDEGHKCKGVNTSNSWMLIALKLQGYRVLVSSATLACSPLEMKAFGYLTNMHSLHNFNDFCRIHGAQWLGRFGAMSWDMLSEEAIKSMQALHNYLYNTTKSTSRMTVDMFGKVFPESHIVANSFDLGSNQKKLESVYDEMEYELAQLEEKSKGYSEHIFAVLMKARRLAELCKVPLFAEKARELYDEGKSVCIFVNFEDSVEGIRKRLVDTWKVPVEEIGFIVGGQADGERKRDINNFNADTKRILIINIAAGGTGISLHDLNGNFPRASLISPNWSAAALRQALGRVHRLNGKTKSYQLIIYGAKTVEENICRRVQAKLQCLDTLNDGEMAEFTNFI